jgi:hypothetical protein
MTASVKLPPPLPDFAIKVYEFNGVRLQPWVPERIIAAQAMGMHYPLIGKKGFEQYKQTGHYPHMVSDVIIAIWLCYVAVSLEQVEDARAMGAEAYKKAEAWAKSLGIYQVGSEKFDVAAKVFTSMVDEPDASATKPIESNDDDPKE